MAQERQRQLLGGVLDTRIQGQAAGASTVGKDAVRTALKDGHGLGRTAGAVARGLEQRDPVAGSRVIARNRNDIFGGADMQGRNRDAGGNGCGVCLAVERRRRNQDRGLDPRIAQLQCHALSCDLRASQQHGGAGAIGMPGCHDPGPVDLRAMLALQQLVEREADVAHPVQGLAFGRSSLQASDQAKGIAEPELPVAADMLDMEAGHTLRRPISTQIAVALARTADAMRKNDQRQLRTRCDLCRPVQPHRHRTLAAGIDPIEVLRPVSGGSAGRLWCW